MQTPVQSKQNGYWSLIQSSLELDNGAKGTVLTIVVNNSRDSALASDVKGHFER